MSIASQSGAYGSHVFHLMRQRGIETGIWITTGNEADVDVADAVAYAGRFLEHLAAFDRPAPDSCGSFVALACGHNAPWRRKERDALYAWLEVQLPPSS